MTTQNYIDIELPEDTFISDIYPFNTGSIPNKSIIHKTITGCGITTFEMRFAEHHSIIILPNVPVIKSKVKDHNKEFPDKEILGVHKGIDVDDIKAYLLKPIKYKKILTTPEGFIKKILKAFEGDEDLLERDYFLLYDECERIITDVSYRGQIAAPLDIFFKFHNKALVSATTLSFSDDRFDAFTHYKVLPLYDYSQPLTVINTNNVISSLKGLLNKIKSQHVCVFLNSTQGIHAISDNLDLKKVSRAFCAEESVVKLLEKGYSNASSEFEAKNMAQYNFFTSRYFSAVDIKLDHKPDVIMITDIFFADHSILDPHTEVIQIAGRFRNGVNSLTHISNFNPMMETKTPQEAVTYLEGCLDTYEHIVGLFKNSKQKGAQDTLDFFVKHSPIASFYTNGKRNSFMIDNDLNQERVKSYYTDRINLEAAYDEVADHFTTTYDNEKYAVGDDDMFTLKNKQTRKERYRQVAMLLERYSSSTTSFKFLSSNLQEQKNILERKYPVITEAHGWIKLKGLEETGYEIPKMRKAITEAKKKHDIERIRPYVHEAFKEHSSPEEWDVLKRLTLIYTEHNVKFAVAASHIKRYFDARRTTQDTKNVYAITHRIISQNN